jgi:hypothetical protein
LINVELRDYMHFFGYASHPSIESPYQFEKYTEQTPEELANYNEYLKVNEKAVGTPQPWKVSGGKAVWTVEDMGGCIASQTEEIVPKNP